MIQYSRTFTLTEILPACTVLLRGTGNPKEARKTVAHKGEKTSRQREADFIGSAGIG